MEVGFENQSNQKRNDRLTAARTKGLIRSGHSSEVRRDGQVSRGTRIALAEYAGMRAGLVRYRQGEKCWIA